MIETRKAVEERRSEWIAAVNECDLDRYAELVTKDVVWLPPSGPPIESRSAFRAWLEPFFGAFDYRFELEPVELHHFEGWCAEVGRFRSVLVDRGGGEAREHSGHYFVLWRRDEDGTWRIERYVDGVGSESPP